MVVVPTTYVMLGQATYQPKDALLVILVTPVVHAAPVGTTRVTHTAVGIDFFLRVHLLKTCLQSRMSLGIVGCEDRFLFV